QGPHATRVPGPLLLSDRADFGTGSAPATAVAAGDFNGDHNLDLAIVSPSADSLTLLAVDGSGHFSRLSAFHTPRGPSSVAIGDVNGDGLGDVLVAELGSNQIGLFRGDSGDPTGLSPDRADFGTGSAPVAVTTGSLNGDGIADVAVANFGSSTVSTFLGT